VEQGAGGSGKDRTSLIIEIEETAAGPNAAAQACFERHAVSGIQARSL